MKISSQMTDDELRKEIYNLRRDLRQKLGEVRAEAKTSPEFYHKSADTDRKAEKKIIARSALDHFKKAEKTMRETSVRDMDTKQLRNIYRDLKYIEGLKSSTLEGATIAASRYDPFAKRMESLTPDARDLVWKVYEELYSHTGGGIEQFKYEIFESQLTDTVTQDNVNEIILGLRSLVEDLESAEDEFKSLSFTESLSKFFDNL